MSIHAYFVQTTCIMKIVKHKVTTVLKIHSNPVGAPAIVGTLIAVYESTYGWNPSNNTCIKLYVQNKKKRDAMHKRKANTIKKLGYA